MAQSPEYPDLLWMPPKSWTDANRTSVQVIVIHTTEGSAHGQSAEDGASYDQRRTDGTSTHYFVDSDSIVQCVRTADQAHTARAQGNRRGIQYELCGRTTLDWLGAYAQAMLRRAAKQAARDCRKWGIPARKLSPGQVADGIKGFCGHVDITHAFPQDNGTHTDPGANFPWTAFLDMVRGELEEDMPITRADVIKFLTEDDIIEAPVGADTTINSHWTLASFERDQSALLRELRTLNTAILAKLSGDLVDEAEVARIVLAGMQPAAVAALVIAALPATLAAQTADEISRRLVA